jgi:hypothetical protein
LKSRPYLNITKVLPLVDLNGIVSKVEPLRRTRTRVKPIAGDLGIQS